MDRHAAPLLYDRRALPPSRPPYPWAGGAKRRGCDTKAPGRRHQRRAPVAGGAVKDHPRWARVLRAVRDARSVTQDGWGARLGVSRRTVQRWERGDVAPEPAVEQGIAAYCAEKSLFRSYGPVGDLPGFELSPELLRDLLADARLATPHGGRGATAPSPHAVADP